MLRALLSLTLLLGLGWHLAKDSHQAQAAKDPAPKTTHSKGKPIPPACRLQAKNWEAPALKLRTSRQWPPFLKLGSTSDRFDAAFSLHQDGPTKGIDATFSIKGITLSGWIKQGTSLPIYPAKPMLLDGGVLLASGQKPLRWTKGKPGKLAVVASTHRHFAPSKPIQRWLSCKQLSLRNLTPKQSDKMLKVTPRGGLYLNASKPLPVRSRPGGRVFGHFRNAASLHVQFIRRRGVWYLVRRLLPDYAVLGWVHFNLVRKTKAPAHYRKGGRMSGGCGAALFRPIRCPHPVSLYVNQRRNGHIHRQKVGTLAPKTMFYRHGGQGKDWRGIRLNYPPCLSLQNNAMWSVPTDALKGCRR